MPDVSSAGRRHDIDLGEIQETLLVPLCGRARDARRRWPLLGDDRAAEIADSIDYDFSDFRGIALTISVVRTAIYDAWVRRFLTSHPSGTVVELGCGLNTRFDRVDNGRVRWFDLDVPDTAALWHRFFTENDRRTLISGSVFDPEWMDEVAESEGPFLFIAEAALLYFPEDDVRDVIEALGTRFPGSQLLVDTGTARMRSGMNKNVSMQGISARMQWVCEDPRELEQWGATLLDSRTYATPQFEVAATWPLPFRIAARVLDRILPSKYQVYRFNRVAFPAAD